MLLLFIPRFSSALITFVIMFAFCWAAVWAEGLWVLTPIVRMAMVGWISTCPLPVTDMVPLVGGAVLPLAFWIPAALTAPPVISVYAWREMSASARTAPTAMNFCVREFDAVCMFRRRDMVPSGDNPECANSCSNH